MKTFCAVFFVLALAITTQGQGTVHFANTGTTLITTNFGNDPISGGGNYRFGLYVALFGNTPNSLVAVTTNFGLPLVGRFEGGQVSVGFSAGTQISFQVRGWSSYGGNTFEEAYAQALSQTSPYPLVGQSTVGFFTVPASAGTIEIFGTGPGQVGGFTLFAVVPEPSTYALSALGVGLWCWFHKRKRS